MEDLPEALLDGALELGLEIAEEFLGIETEPEQQSEGQS